VIFMEGPKIDAPELMLFSIRQPGNSNPHRSRSIQSLLACHLQAALKSAGLIEPAQITQLDYHPGLPTEFVSRRVLLPFHFENEALCSSSQQYMMEDRPLAESLDSIRQAPDDDRRVARANPKHLDHST